MALVFIKSKPTRSPRRDRPRIQRSRGAALLVANLWIAAARAGDPGAALSYTAAQAEHGRALYQQHCASCHGNRLNDGQFGTPLKGSYFRSHWRDRTAAELLAFAVTQMPPAQPRSLTEQEHADVLAFLLQANGVAAGEVAFSRETLRLEAIVFSW
jgi:mono/diheme cytochrome c family protein